MSKTNKDWSQDRKGAFNHVFLEQQWGDSSNAGKNYKRKNVKTKQEK